MYYVEKIFKKEVITIQNRQCLDSQKSVKLSKLAENLKKNKIFDLTFGGRFFFLLFSVANIEKQKQQSFTLELLPY